MSKRLRCPVRKAATRSSVIFGVHFNIITVSRGGVIQPTGGLIHLAGGAENYWLAGALIEVEGGVHGSRR